MELTLGSGLLPEHVQVDGGRRWAARADISGHLEQPSDLMHLSLPGLDSTFGKSKKKRPRLEPVIFCLCTHRNTIDNSAVSF